MPTFNYTGAVQTWTVPSGGAYRISCYGAGGGNGLTASTTTVFGGRRAVAHGDINFSGGETLYIYVGGIGTHYVDGGGTASGGWNGGGASHPGVSYSGGGGGGASDVRLNGTTLAHRIIVAGGGGGAGSGAAVPTTGTAAGGNAGGLEGSAGGTTTNSTGTMKGGGGGTQSAGGAGGTGGNADGGTGSLGVGGEGFPVAGYAPSGGGGGGGYYGGGGGGSRMSGTPDIASGGGGGSCYIHPTYFSNQSSGGTTSREAGYVTITALNSPPTVPTINTPTGLVAGQPKTITWSASTDPDSNPITYKLERAINGISTFTEIYSGSNLSYEDTLGSWTQVQYRVKATDGTADSEYSTTAVLTVAQLCIPTATAPVSAAKVNVKTSKEFTFTGSKTFTHYEIQYRKGADDWTSTGQVASTTGSHTFAANTFVGTGDPVYEYQIQLKDTETGLWSGWTTSYTFTAFQPYATTGTYESAPFNHGKEFLTGTLTWSATVPAGTSITGYYATSNDGTTWGAWTSATSGMTIPAGTTWIKTKFDLTPSADGLTTPSIASISVYYDDQYYAEGTWYSPIMDISQAVTTFADIATTFNTTLNGGAISYYTRHKFLPSDTWSDWQLWGSGTTTVNNYMQLKVVITPEATRAISPVVTGLKFTYGNDTKKSIWLSQPIDVSLAKDLSNSKAIADSLYHGGQIVMYSRSKESLGGTWTAWSLALEDGTLTHTPNVYIQIMLVLINNAEVRELTLSLDGDASVEVIKAGMTPGATYSFTILDDLAVIVNGNDQPLKWDSINPPAVLNADPPILSMVLTHHNRAWGVDSETPSRLRYSNILDPTKWDAYDFIDFNPDDGDMIMAIVRYGQNLVVSKQRSMALLTGNRSSNYNVSWLDSESGATGMNAICVADKYLAYVAQDGIRFTDLAQSVIATERLNPSWANINKRRLNQAALIYWKNRLFAALPSEGSLYNDTVWVYDFLRNSWSIIDGWEVSTWHRFNQYGEDILLAGDSTTGQLYHVDVTSYDDTIPVEYEWRSKDFNFKAPEKYKLFRNVFLDLEGVAETTNLYVDLIVDGDVKGTYNTVIPAGEGVKHTRRILPPIYGAVLGSAFGLRIRGRCGVQSITIQYAIRGNIPGGEL